MNGDGLPDTYCATGANYGTDVKGNELWIQQPDQTFVDQAAQYNALDPFGRGRDVVMFDANGDGHPDLFIGNIRERGDGLPSPNRLLL